jgi:hypothetical protein
VPVLYVLAKRVGVVDSSLHARGNVEVYVDRANVSLGLPLKARADAELALLWNFVIQ